MTKKIIIFLITLALGCFYQIEGAELTPQDLASLQPYLIADNNPLKIKLDAIFTHSRPTFDDDSLVKAGFKILYNQPRSFIRVVKHPMLKGVLIKANLDSDLRLKQNIPSWKWFLNRCIGANKIAFVIKSCGIRHFTVPKKWIYVLPDHPEQLQGIADPKPVILVAQNMHLVTKQENRLAWRQKITKRHLRELYKIMYLAGGSSYRASNIWYTKEGKFAFIDTEYPFAKPNFKSITPYLNKKMRKYWNRLTKPN